MKIINVRIKRGPRYCLYLILSIMVFISAIKNSLFRPAFPQFIAIIDKSLLLFRVVLAVTALFLMLKRGMRKSESVMMCVYPIFLLLSFGFSRSYDFFDSLFVAIFLYKDLDYRKVVEVFYKSLLSALTIIVAAYAIGVFPALQVFRDSGRLRMSCGFLHPNDLSRVLMLLCFLYVLRKENEISTMDYMGLLCLSFFVFVFPNSKNVSICIIFFIILLFFRYLSLKITGKNMFLSRRFRFVCIAVFFLTIAGIWFFCMNSRAYNWINTFESTIRSRFRLAHRGLEQYGIKLFGSEITFAAEYGAAFENQSYFVLDSVYFYLPIARGMIPSVYILFMYIKNISECFKRHNTTLLFVLIVMIVYSAVEPGILYFISSFIFILPQVNHRIGTESRPAMQNRNNDSKYRK